MQYGERVRFASRTDPGVLKPDFPPDNDIAGAGAEDGIATHIPGQPKPDVGPFIRTDEEVREEMSEREKERRRTLRRLRLTKLSKLDASMGHNVVYDEKDDGKYIISARGVDLYMVLTGGERPKITWKCTSHVCLHELSELPPQPLLKSPTVIEQDRMSIQEICNYI